MRSRPVYPSATPRDPDSEGRCTRRLPLRDARPAGTWSRAPAPSRTPTSSQSARAHAKGRPARGYPTLLDAMIVAGPGRGSRNGPRVPAPPHFCDTRCLAPAAGVGSSPRNGENAALQGCPLDLAWRRGLVTGSSSHDDAGRSHQSDRERDHRPTHRGRLRAHEGYRHRGKREHSEPVEDDRCRRQGSPGWASATVGGDHEASRTCA